MDIDMGNASVHTKSSNKLDVWGTGDTYFCCFGGSL